jgi:hypothetical protein
MLTSPHAEKALSLNLFCCARKSSNPLQPLDPMYHSFMPVDVADAFQVNSRRRSA